MPPTFSLVSRKPRRSRIYQTSVSFSTPESLPVRLTMLVDRSHPGPQSRDILSGAIEAFLTGAWVTGPARQASQLPRAGPLESEARLHNDTSGVPHSG